MSKTTPTYGLTYAEGTDVPDIGYWTKALADAVEAALTAQGISDTGWIVVPWADARITNYGVGTEARYRIKNGVCTITGQATTQTAGLIDTGVTAFNIPAAARPAYRLGSVQQTSGDDRYALFVNTTGAVSFERFGTSAQPAGVWLPFAISYLVG